MAQLGSVLAVTSCGVLCKALDPSGVLSCQLKAGDVHITFLKYSIWFYNNIMDFFSGIGPWLPISGWFVNSLGNCAKGGKCLSALCLGQSLLSVCLLIGEVVCLRLIDFSPKIC